MLDLDSLAEKRAKSLNEQEEQWRRALWHEDFQKVVKNMSDGEVETLLTYCPSLTHFERVMEFLRQPGFTAAPYGSLQQAAGAAGLSLGDWIQKLPGFKT